MIAFRKMDSKDKDVVRAMVKNFYKESPELKPIVNEKIIKTFSEFEQFPEKGTFFVIEDSSRTVGYTIVTVMWSNEYGGNVLDVDELFVVGGRRGEGIGTTFIKWLIQHRPWQCVSIELGTTLGNTRARALYEKLGFKLSDSHRFSYDF